MNELSAKLQALSEKYSITYSHVIKKLQDMETTLISLINELAGNEFDMKGLSEFQSLLIKK